MRGRKSLRGAAIPIIPLCFHYRLSEMLTIQDLPWTCPGSSSDGIEPFSFLSRRQAIYRHNQAAWICLAMGTAGKPPSTTQSNCPSNRPPTYRFEGQYVEGYSDQV